MHLHLLNMLGTLSWDPQIRGILIVATVVVMLPGSIYLLLATNVGARMGFLLAIAGITGWTMILGVTWAFYGQGLKGRDPSWKVQEVVHTTSAQDLSAGTLKTLNDYPNGWQKLPLSGSPILGDALAATDNFVTKSGRKPKLGPEGPIVKDPTPAMLRFPAEFSDSSGYTLVGGYNKGGDNQLFTIRHHKFYLRHSPHYVAVILQPMVTYNAVGGVIPPPTVDTTKPLTVVILLRDLGSIRFPQVMIAIASAIIFGVTCLQLHRRDKQIMAARAAGAVPAAA